MAKKRKKDTAHRVPPLSGVDTAIYVLLAALLAAGIIALLFFWDDLHRWIAFQNAAVIASRPGGSYLVLLPLLLLTEIGGMVALMCLWGGKQPIFGRKGVRYGEYPWKTDLFPVLGPRRGKARVAASERRFRKATRQVLLGMGLAFLLLLPLGLFERDCLREDLSIVEYDILNRASAPISVADCDSLTIMPIRQKGRYVTYGWTYGLTIRCVDGSSWQFRAGDFDLGEGGHTECLRQMLAIKALFPDGSIETEGEDRIPEIIEYCGFTHEQIVLLRELFE